MLDNCIWVINKAKHLEMSSYTIGFDGLEGTMSERPRFGKGLVLGVPSRGPGSGRDSP